MENWLSRTSLLFGDDKIKKLEKLKVVVLGLGGVGSAAAEAICRCGVGNIMLVDKDTVSITNINRQLIALNSTVGEYKTTAMRSRLLDINSYADIICKEEFVLPDNSQFIWDYQPHFIIDAIDTITSKLFVAQNAPQYDISVVSSMGTGGRQDPTQIRTGDIKETAGTSCAISRLMRRELKKRGVDKLKVVYSLEIPSKTIIGEENGRHPPASCALVPPVVGFALAACVVNNII